MKKLTFTSVQLLDFGRDSKGGWATFSASLTKQVLTAMEWTEPSECEVKATFEGELAATVITLTPSDEPLKRHAIDLETRKISGFQVIRLELDGSRGKGHRFELRFAVAFADITGCKKLEAYMLTCGKSSMAVSYEPQAKQQDLPGVEADSKQNEMPVQ